MALARIVARSPQASNLVARKLRALGFQIEAHATRVDSGAPADLEVSIEECAVEYALERAAREGKWVFIAPGALAEGVVIDFTAQAEEATNDQLPEPVAELAVAPEIVLEAAAGEPVLEALNEPVTFSVPESEVTNLEIARTEVGKPEVGKAEVAEIEAEPLQAEIFASAAATISDLVASAETSDPLVMIDLPAEASRREEIPSPLEIEPVLVAGNLEEPLTAVEFRGEGMLQPVEVEAEAPEPAVQNSTPAEPPPMVLEAASENLSVRDLPEPPAPELLPAPAPAEPRLQENLQEVVKVKAISVPAASRAPRKIHIVLPGFKQRAYLWASVALVFTIGVVGMILISSKPVSHPVSMQPQTSAASAQTPRPITNAPAAPKASATAAPQAASAVTRRHPASSDEGYIAKDTVVRYGSSTAAPSRKSAAKARSGQN